MYVCLMRHGKAEPYHDGMDDKKRELIEKGKKQAAAMLDAARLWWPEGTTVLWASPYIRTCQTAAFFDTRIPYNGLRHGPVWIYSSKRAAWPCLIMIPLTATGARRRCSCI